MFPGPVTPVPKKLLDDQVPLIESSPLRSAIRRVRRANDNTSLVFRNGSIIDVLASSATAGHGKTLDLVIDGGSIVAEHSSIIDLTGDEPVVVRKGKGNLSFISEEK